MRNIRRCENVQHIVFRSSLRKRNKYQHKCVVNSKINGYEIDFAVARIVYETVRIELRVNKQNNQMSTQY